MLEKQVTTTAQNQETNQFFRFQVFQGINEAGKIKRTKTVGMAYLKNGQHIFSLRLWTFLNERFYVIPNKNDSSKYLVMTREPNKNPEWKNKYFWNIVGNGCVDTIQGIVTLKFDLLSEPIYLNIHPENQTHSSFMPDPENWNQQAA